MNRTLAYSLSLVAGFVVAATSNSDLRADALCLLGQSGDNCTVAVFTSDFIFYAVLFIFIPIALIAAFEIFTSFLSSFFSTKYDFVNNYYADFISACYELHRIYNNKKSEQGFCLKFDRNTNRFDDIEIDQKVDDLLSSIVNMFREKGGGVTCSLLIPMENGGLYLSHIRYPPGYIVKIDLKDRLFADGVGYCGHACDTGKVVAGRPYLVNFWDIRLFRDKRFDKKEGYSEDRKSYFNFPLIDERDNRVIGIISVDSKNYFLFTSRQSPNEHLSKTLYPATRALYGVLSVARIRGDAE